MNQGRQVPFNQEAELYVLGSIFIDNDVINSAIGKLNPSDFYDENNRAIYQAMVQLNKQETRIEILTVIEELRRQKLNLTVDPREYLLELVDAVPSTVTTSLYIDIVVEKAVERELLKNLREISDDILTSKLEFNKLLDKTEDRVQAIIKKRRTSKFLSIEKAAEDAYYQIERFSSNKSEITGLSTGFERLDKATFGFQKGDLIILAARPSVGKSAFALNLALNVCRKNNAHVAFFSLEMSIEQIMMRLFSYQSYIAMNKIRSGRLTSRELIILGHARNDLKSNNLYFDESNSSDIYEIRAKCRELKQSNQLDLVIIDYLQLITGTKKFNRQEEVADISRNLKILAKELNVPIIALSQLSRLVESRDEKRPVLSDLRESGSIEQDADIVMFLYRPDDIKKKRGKEASKAIVEAAEVASPPITEGTSREIAIELNIAKNRQGGLRDIYYTFIPEESRFKETSFSEPFKNKLEKQLEN